MILTIKTKAIINLIAVSMLVLFICPQITLSQDSTVSSSSPYYFGAIGGYTALLKESKLAESFNRSELTNGYSIGFFFDYKLPSTNTFLQFQTENNELNFSTSAGDNIQNIRFTTIGLKMYIKGSERLYFTIGTGIMTNKNIETQMIMSFNLGYDIYRSKNGSGFFQIGLNGKDTGDNFISIRFGTRLNL